MTRDHESFRDDLAAYLLGALSGDEAEELERHLEGCRDCRERLGWLWPALDVLPASVEQLEPPTRLRERLLAIVREEVPRRAPARARERSRRRPWRGLSLRPATGLAAAVVLGVGVGAGYLLDEDGATRSVIQAQPTAAAPEGEVAASLVQGGGTAMLDVERLPALRGRRVYQAWVQRDGVIEPASVFIPRRDGSTYAAIPGPLEGADAVLVTSEPHGGSERPTTAPLLRAPLR
jgi:anti-sigma factor RsiW